MAESNLTWFIRNLILDTPFSRPSTHIILSPRMFRLFCLSLLATSWPSYRDRNVLSQGRDPKISCLVSPWNIQLCTLTSPRRELALLSPVQWSCLGRKRRTRSCRARDLCTFPRDHTARQSLYRDKIASLVRVTHSMWLIAARTGDEFLVNSQATHWHFVIFSTKSLETHL